LMIYKEQLFSAEFDVEQPDKPWVSSAHGTKQGDQLHWLIFRPFSLADCPAQLCHSNLKTHPFVMIWNKTTQRLFEDMV
jgi:hypothetical protein